MYKYLNKPRLITLLFCLSPTSIMPRNPKFTSNDLDALVDTYEGKNMSNLEIAIAMVKDHGTSQEQTADVCGINRNKLCKALKVIRDGREV